MRDSLFGEQIVWSGAPKVLTVPRTYATAGVFAAALSLVSLAFAVVVATGLRQPVEGMIAFSAWCATLAVFAWRLPLWFRSKVTYRVTEKHVVWQRGPLRRTIERDAISYAVIRWSGTPGIGDLVLVRAVPTGALRRTLSVTLADVEAPDRLWAVVRGLVPGAPLGDGARSIGQRLDDGERVLWTARPASPRWTRRRALNALLGAAMFGVLAFTVARALPAVLRVLRGHALSALGASMLVAGVSLAVLSLAFVAGGIAYAALVRPGRLARETRYMVTDRRVLIRRGSEELHLDRQRIAYVISTPSTRGRRGTRRDLFLVLDGPRARAFSSSGAFDGGGDERLVPMFADIDDADTATELLHVSRIEAAPRAA